MKWCKSKTSLVGKTVIITGANTGIGYETALDLANRGGRVILACRDSTKAEAARSKIVEETGNKNVVVKLLDLSSFASVRKFAEDINATEKRLDVLINNAGAALYNGESGDGRTEDGQVFIMQVNHLSHFLLTNLLIDLIKKSAPSRIVNVSSLGAKYANLDVDKLEKFPGNMRIYSNSKLCNILFTMELSDRLKPSGVTAYSLHPGAVDTELARNATGCFKCCWNAFTPAMLNSEEGAQTTIYLAVTKGIEEDSGEHFEDCTKVKRYATAKKPGLAKKLWEASEKIVQLN